MELKRLLLNQLLRGINHITFDNTNIDCTGVNIIPENSPNYLTTEAYVFNLLTSNMTFTGKSYIAVFKQEGEDITLKISNKKFRLLSFPIDSIILTDGVSNYVITPVKAY